MINSILLAIPGAWSIILIIVAIVLLFGGRKIPELMKGIGQGMTEFKKATKKDKEDNKEEASDKKVDKE